jgi:hypothetical protein
MPSRGQGQISRQHEEPDEVFKQGHHRSRGTKRHPPKAPKSVIKELRQEDDSNADDSLSERDDEVERILSGILDTTSPSHPERNLAFPSQEQHHQGQSEGHAFEPYGRQDSTDAKSSQPHSNFYQSVQVPLLQDGSQTSRQHVPTNVQNTAPPSASGPKKVLLKSMSVPEPVSFTSADDNQMTPPSPKEQQQNPLTRREAFARSKTIQAEITSDQEMSDSALLERKRRQEKMPLVSTQSISTDSMSHDPLSVYQSEGESAPPKVPKAYKAGPTLTFINGIPCEVPQVIPAKKSPRRSRHADQHSAQMQRTKSLDADVYHEQIRNLESASEIDETYQSDSKLSPAYANSRGNIRENIQEQSSVNPNRYSGAYDNVQGSDYDVPPPGGDRTDSAHYEITAPPVLSDKSDGAQTLEPVGNPAVFVDVLHYGDSQDVLGYQDSFSFLQPPEEDLRKSPSVREMAAERESAEAAHQEENQRYRKKKPYSTRKMSMPIESQTEKMRVRKMSLEGAVADMSGSDTDERSQRNTPIQPQGQDLVGGATMHDLASISTHKLTSASGVRTYVFYY